MVYECVTDEFEVRSAVTDKLKRLWIKGYAAFKGLDTYGTRLSQNAMKKIADELKTKNIKVGIQHQKVLGDKITNRLLSIREQLSSEGKNTKEIDQALEYNSARHLPIGKPREVKFDEEGVMVEVEINPYLSDIDPEYYNALTNMIKDGFFDGFSIEFNNEKIHDEYDAKGSRVRVIEDLSTNGLSLVSGAANSGARITDIFVRMAGIEEEKEEEIRMAEDKKDMVEKSELDKVMAELEATKKQLKELEASNVEVDKMLDKKEKEIEQVKKEKEESERTITERLNDVEALLKESLEKGKLSSAKGIVSPEDKYGAKEEKDTTDTEAIAKELDKKPLSELMAQMPQFK